MGSYPWEHGFSDDTLPRAASALRPDELQFLLWCGAQNSGRGILVDVESPLADAARQFAVGMAKAGEKSPSAPKQVELFSVLAFSEADRTRLGASKDATESDVLTLLKARWGDSAAGIRRRKAPSRTLNQRAPIEAIYCGSATNWEQFELYLKVFVSRLIPGSGVLVLRDYVHTYAYWLNVFMERYESHFEALSPRIGASTAAWILRKPLPSSAINEPLNASLKIGDLLALMDKSIARYAQPHSTLLEIKKSHLIADAIGVEQAGAYAEGVRERAEGTPAALPHIDRFIDWTKTTGKRRPRPKRAFLS